MNYKAILASIKDLSKRGNKSAALNEPAVESYLSKKDQRPEVQEWIISGAVLGGLMSTDIMEQSRNSICVI